MWMQCQLKPIQISQRNISFFFWSSSNCTCSWIQATYKIDAFPEKLTKLLKNILSHNDREREKKKSWICLFYLDLHQILLGSILGQDTSSRRKPFPSLVETHSLVFVWYCWQTTKETDPGKFCELRNSGQMLVIQECPWVFNSRPDSLCGGPLCKKSSL